MASFLVINEYLSSSLYLGWGMVGWLQLCIAEFSELFFLAAYNRNVKNGMLFICTDVQKRRDALHTCIFYISFVVESAKMVICIFN